MINQTHISKDEFDNIKNKVNTLISSHNTLQRIIEVFNTDPIIKEYFEKAEEEVLESGNQSLASMMCIALREMAYDLKYYKEHEESDEAELIRQLKNENEKLRAKNNKLKSLINKVYGDIGANVNIIEE